MYLRLTAILLGLVILPGSQAEQVPGVVIDHQLLRRTST